MTTSVTSLDQIDLDISIAFIALGVSRTAYARCPSGENQLAVDRARAAVDQLLDDRLAARS